MVMVTSIRRRLLSSLFLFSLVNSPFVTISETPCPYPCYPPPIGGGSQVTPPAGYYPQPTGYYPPPTSGNVLNYPSPPNVGGTFGGGYYGPPPPDPIMPYFPYYYKQPPHLVDQSSSSSMVVTVANVFLVLAFLLGNLLLTS